MAVILLALVVVVVAIVAGVALAGGSLLGTGRPDGALAGGVTLLAGVGAVVVVAILGLLTIGLRGSGSNDTTAPEPPKPERAQPVTTTAPIPLTGVSVEDALEATEGRPEIRLTLSEENDFPSPGPALGQLADNHVVVVAMAGFDAEASGRLAQCHRRLDELHDCTNGFPVQFNGAGAARVQYGLTNTVAGVPCGGDHPCFIAVSSNGRTVTGSLTFGEPTPTAPVVSVTPPAGLTEGDRVAVAVERAVPGSVLAVVHCKSGHPKEERCFATDPATLITADAEGRGNASLELRDPLCTRDQRCGFTVATPAGAIVAPVTRITLTRGATAGYDGRRLIAGGAVALVLLAVATWLVRRTDWREPTEAATPELDAATLT